LDALEGSLTGCSENKLHFYPRDADECPWCFMEKQLGSVLFVPYVPGAKLVEGFDPGAASFNIDVIWRQIAAIAIPPRSELVPRSLPAAIPSTGNLSAGRYFQNIGPLRTAGVVCAAALLVVKPALWFVSLGLAGFSLFWGLKTQRVAPVMAKLSEVENRWITEVLAWQKRSGVDDFLRQRQTLEATREEYVGLDQHKRREIENYKSQRRQRQLQAFLDNFEIRNSKIRGIGPAKQAALASFGVDTAADITMAKVLAVPGIGHALAQDMLKWRTTCERKFVYSERQIQTDIQELNNISAKFATKAASLRRTLSAGPANLSALAQRVRTAVSIEDPAVGRLGAERDALIQKLKKFGGTPPATIDWDARASGASSGRRSVSSGSHFAPPTRPIPVAAPVRSTSSAGARSCPRCAAGMVLRTARRGRNSGSTFWGCSRYPVCRGTRNV
jgi:DNA-binding helix-hairpin-helix protein with protein kinase domain